ncbi:MAG: hypothetical protein Fur0037_03580 [Planctomycetota bacterium]
MAKIPDKQGVFFELDGVVLKSVRLDESGGLDYEDRAIEALARIDPATFRIFVATSRPDIAFGKLKEREFTKVCEVFLARMKQEGIPIAKIYSCPFHPKGKGRFRRDSVFRKPAPGIFKMAQQEFDLNLARCWMIGSTTADILAAQRAGVGTILVGDGADREYVVEAHFQEANLWDAVLRINRFEHALRI